MGQGFKQRLLGAAVLMIVLVILAPALFRGGESHPLVTDTIEFPKNNHKVPEFIGVLDQEPEPINIQETAVRPVEDDRGQSGIDSEGFLKAWSLQLASFSDENNAIKLRDSLRSKKHTAYIRKVIRDSGQPLFRVYIGPEVRTKELSELRDQLKDEMGLSGMVVRYQP